MYRYCGPWWSDGKIQLSVKNGEQSENELDELCKIHDNHWWSINNGLTDNADDVDLAFEKAASSLGFIGKTMATAVGINRVIRNITTPAGDKMKGKKNGNLRGSAAKPVNAKPTVKSTQVSKIGSMQLSAPAAISSVFTSQPTRTSSIAKGIVAAGKEYIGSVSANGVSTFGLGKSALLSPCYFYGGVLGNLARAYSKYRFRKVIIHYIPSVATSVGGQIVMCTSTNVTQPALAGESNSFMQRALVSGNGVMGPIWTPLRMEVPTDSKKRYIDCLTNTDIDENIFAELQVYAQITSTGIAGQLWMEYECELTENLLEPHSNDLPVAIGPGARAVFACTTATPVVNNAVEFNEVTSLGLISYPNGTIFRFVLDFQGTLLPTGMAPNNAWNVITSRNVTTASTSTTVSTDNIVGGMTLYITVWGSVFYVYVSVEQAVIGSGSGQLTWKTAGTSAGGFAGDLTVVRLGNARIDDVQ